MKNCGMVQGIVGDGIVGGKEDCGRVTKFWDNEETCESQQDCENGELWDIAWNVGDTGACVTEESIMGEMEL